MIVELAKTPNFQVECQLANNDVGVDAPTEDDMFVQSFPRLLERTLLRNKRSRLVLVLDGLDNLDESALPKVRFAHRVTHSSPRN